MKKSYYFVLLLAMMAVIFSSINQQNSNSFNLKELDESAYGNDFTPQDFVPKLAQGFGNFSEYNLTIVMDESSSSVLGNLTVDFYNNDAQNFTQIPFHLYLSQMMYETRQGELDIINVTDFIDPNENLTFTIEDERLLWVTLNETLEPFERVQFVIEFNATIPDGGYDRSNSHGDDVDESRIFKFASFYPIPCVFDENGWHTKPYTIQGESFYLDSAFYHLYVEVPKNMTVAATGTLMTFDTIYKTNTTIYHYDSVGPVREVTFSASKYFIRESLIINLVNVSTYFLPKSSRIWANNATFYGALALDIFRQAFGAYLYPTFNVVEEYTIFGGMEYSCQVYITEAIDSWTNDYELEQWYLELIIAHETSHQWWYNIVGNDQFTYGFMDEGLAVWSTDFYGEIAHARKAYFQNETHVDLVRSYFASTGNGVVINQTLEGYNSTNTDYYFAAYRKTPAVLERLRSDVEEQFFLSGLKNLYNQYMFQHFTLNDFQQAMERATGKDLDYFFLPWFNNPYLPKYEITSISFDVGTRVLSFTVTDNNEPLHDYTYSQLVLIDLIDRAGNILYRPNIFPKTRIIALRWINSTTSIRVQLDLVEPLFVRLNYEDRALVQLHPPFSPSTTREVPYQLIPGFNLSITITICLTAIFIAFWRIKRKLRQI